MTMLVWSWYNSMLCETVIKTLFMGRRVGGDAKAVELSGFGSQP